MVDAVELPIDITATAQQMAESIFGDDIQIVANSVSYSGDAVSSGIYSNGLTVSPGFAPSDTGVILSTGAAQSVTNTIGEANQAGDTTTDTVGGIDGDADFDAAASQATFDAAFIEASFIPQGNTLTMQIVFGSEEYPEFVNAGFNDTIGVWVNGQQVQLSVGAGQTSVDAVNSGSNSNLFIDNTTDGFNTEMDGFTITLALNAPVTAGAVNTIKIGVADAGDASYDSNILIAASSIQSVVTANDDAYSIGPNNEATVDLRTNDVAQGTLEITHINGQPVFADVPIQLPSGEIITLNQDGTVSIETDGDIGSNTFAYTVADANGVSASAFVTLTTAVPCFTSGAMIETASGPRAIEDLRLGDKIVTRDDGLQPLRWIGSKTVNGHSDKFAPIWFRASVCGADRDFAVSQQHRMLLQGWRARVLFGVSEVMVRAKDMVNGADVVVQKVDTVNYWHMLFDQHQVVYADGAPSESFHPGPESVGSLDDEARCELFNLFPELRADPSSYGPSARTSLRRHEAQVLMSA